MKQQGLCPWGNKCTQSGFEQDHTRKRIGGWRVHIYRWRLRRGGPAPNFHLQHQVKRQPEVGGKAPQQLPVSLKDMFTCMRVFRVYIEGWVRKIPDSFRKFVLRIRKKSNLRRSVSLLLGDCHSLILLDIQFRIVNDLFIGKRSVLKGQIVIFFGVVS